MATYTPFSDIQFNRDRTSVLAVGTFKVDSIIKNSINFGTHALFLYKGSLALKENQDNDMPEKKPCAILFGENHKVVRNYFESIKYSRNINVKV